MLVILETNEAISTLWQPYWMLMNLWVMQIISFNYLRLKTLKSESIVIINIYLSIKYRFLKLCSKSKPKMGLLGTLFSKRVGYHPISTGKSKNFNHKIYMYMLHRLMEVFIDIKQQTQRIYWKKHIHLTFHCSYHISFPWFPSSPAYSWDKTISQHKNNTRTFEPVLNRNSFPWVSCVFNWKHEHGTKSISLVDHLGLGPELSLFNHSVHASRNMRLSVMWNVLC